jgi:hypothetical protein
VRLPRVRFTVRRLMVYVAVIAVVPHLPISPSLQSGTLGQACRRSRLGQSCKLPLRTGGKGVDRSQGGILFGSLAASP